MTFNPVEAAAPVSPEPGRTRVRDRGWTTELHPLFEGQLDAERKLRTLEAAPVSAKGDREAPTFEELKEIQRLREFAKMVTDQPCFTNAILAITDAYREGWQAALDHVRGKEER